MPAEKDEKRDDVLRRMLKTPPKPRRRPDGSAEKDGHPNGPLDTIHKKDTDSGQK